jgi:serine phosphatase RsbU (regulator of sigma subunit)
MFFPLSIAFSILRYRLWEIDVIVNRTLVYSALTALLALIYVGSVLLLEQIFRPLLRNNQIAAVISTLAIVSLFNPLRQRVQDFIDIRFYRRKYDMAKTLSAFGLTLRDEVDLTHLIHRLEEVIWETMQPAFVFSWLHTPDGFKLHPDHERPTSTDRSSTESDGASRLARLAIQQARLLDRGLNSEIPLHDPFVAHLRFASGAVELELLDFDSPAVKEFRASGLHLVLPLISQGELIGWLGLGPRLSESDYSADDRILLANLALQASPAVRVAMLVRKEQAQAVERERMEYELRLAREIQIAMLPKALPSLAGWSVATHYQPARSVGGDFYDFISRPDGQLGVVIGDVTGKGVPAAMLMATTRSALRAVAQERLSPGDVLKLVNAQLELDIPNHMFVTCLYAILDPATGRLVYANAGHNLPLRRSSHGVEELRAHGVPLGLMADMSYEEKEAILEPGDTLLLHSDGLVEAHNADREMFGSPRLRSLVAEASGGSRLVEAALEELSRFVENSFDQEDDITLVVLQRSRER